MSTSTNKLAISGFAEMARSVQTYVSGKLENINFSGLQDTPSGYLGHSGDYLIVNDGESGIHFTGIEKIASDLTDYGFGGGSSDIPKYTNLPDPTENDGKIVASGCDLYYGCDGEWKKIGADSIPPPENVPGCVSDLEEYSQYQEYKDGFLADNLNTSFDSMFNGGQSTSDLIIDVCLFSEVNNQTNNTFNPKTDNTIVIEESTYKWGMFGGQTEINLSGNAYIDPDGEIECTFMNWQSSEVVSFGDANSDKTTAIINKDTSITGYFNCRQIGTPFNCPDIPIHIQSNNNDLPADKSSYQRDMFFDTLNSTNEVTLFGDSVFLYDQNSDYLRPTLPVNMDTMSDDYNFTNYPFMTIETWYRPSSFELTGGTSQRLFNMDSKDLIVNGTTNNNAPVGTLILQGIGQVWKIPDSQLTLDQWHHIAVVYERSGKIISVYINGELKGSVNNANFIDSISDWWIGSRGASIGTMRGYLQDFKVTVGQVYTSNFTPPSSLHNKCT